MIGSRVVDGLPALTLASAAAGGIEATFVPGAGMVGCSLRHRGEELLGQRRGLRAYVAERATMGIPLLYPWANRVARRRFTVAGREVVIDPEVTPLRLDADGLPMHGLLTAARGWQVERHEPVADGAVLAARFDFAAHEALMAAFPFAHRAALRGDAAGTDADDHHDGPGIGRRAGADRLRLSPLSPPARRRARGLARRGSGPRAAAPGLADAAHRRARKRGGPRRPAGARTFDDAFVAPPDAAPFVLAGGDRRIELAFLAGYPYAQVFAPAEDDVIAFEPMTAPTNALVDGGAELPLLAPGESYEASFSITLADGDVSNRRPRLTRSG